MVRHREWEEMGRGGNKEHLRVSAVWDKHSTFCISFLLFSPSFCPFPSYSHFNLGSSSPPLSSLLSPVVLLFLSPALHPLSTSSFPPYLTGCHSNSTRRRVNAVYLFVLVLPSTWWTLLLHHGRVEGERGDFNIWSRSNHPHSTHLSPHFAQLNPSPRPPLPLFQLNHRIERVHTGEQVPPEFPGSPSALSSEAEVWTMGLRWIGLATSNVSLTHRVNNERGKKETHTQRSRWEGQHGQRQFVVGRQEGGSY